MATIEESRFRHTLAHFQEWAQRCISTPLIRRISVPVQVCLVLFLVTAFTYQYKWDGSGPYLTLDAHLPVVANAAKPWQEEKREFAEVLIKAFNLSSTKSMDFSGWILEAAAQQKLDPYLLASVIATESTFRVQAVSPVGAVGPAQVIPTFWSDFCVVDDLHDPARNIECGAAVLGFFIDKTGKESDALRAYNVGFASIQLGGYLLERADVYVSRVYENQRRLHESA